MQLSRRHFLAIDSGPHPSADEPRDPDANASADRNAAGEAATGDPSASRAPDGPDPDNRDTPLAQMALHIPALPEQIGQVYGLLARFDEETEPWLADGMVYPAFMTAVVEIATNIMRHAYPSPPEEEPEAQGTPGMLALTLTLFAHRLHAEFRDQGIPFSPAASAEEAPAAGSADAPGEGDTDAGPLAGLAPNAPHSDADELLDLPEGGFGLFVARQALDVLDYRRTPEGDNCWILVKEF